MANRAFVPFVSSLFLWSARGWFCVWAPWKRGKVLDRCVVLYFKRLVVFLFFSFFKGSSCFVTSRFWIVFVASDGRCGFTLLINRYLLFCTRLAPSLPFSAFKINGYLPFLHQTVPSLLLALFSIWLFHDFSYHRTPPFDILPLSNHEMCRSKNLFHLFEYLARCVTPLFLIHNSLIFYYENSFRAF